VSSRHLQVRATPGDAIEVTDLNSANGTRVDGNRIERATEVRQGGTIDVGQSALRIIASNLQQVPVPAATAGYEPLVSAPIPPGQSRINAGPIAHGNIDLSGENVAGRDLHLHEGFRIRSRMRPAAKKLLYFGLALFFIGLAISFAGVAAFNSQVLNTDLDPQAGFSSEIGASFSVFFLGGGLNLLGLVCIVIALVMRRERVQEAVLARRR
jgi:uncharacterized membrane protein (DUF485 family)